MSLGTGIEVNLGAAQCFGQKSKNTDEYSDSYAGCCVVLRPDDNGAAEGIVADVVADAEVVGGEDVVVAVVDVDDDDDEVEELADAVMVDKPPEVQVTGFWVTILATEKTAERYCTSLQKSFSQDTSTPSS
ncbi:hypothetical protein UA08_02228 [Talaromyces atroroseus]|uniref:Uncharacterized protein n=1 Tax=Talaromyces atroroseus TaxID=1441469 RepID=A0A225B342_TALAT|nr:hypothetical protein UA08_02228 [Talaromyces atroroseus]OKL62419.1 hypothetical protein UA08_02228 [Talaromyces atroroseus]